MGVDGNGLIAFPGSTYIPGNQFLIVSDTTAEIVFAEHGAPGVNTNWMVLNSYPGNFTASNAPLFLMAYQRNDGVLGEQSIIAASNVTAQTFIGGGPGLTNLVAATQSGHTNVSGATSVVVVLHTPYPSTNYTAIFMSDTASAIIASQFVTAKTPTNFTANFSTFTGNIDWTANYQTQ
jgi:hypothetical protein